MDNKTDLAYKELASAQIIILRAFVEVARNAPQCLLMLDWSKSDIEKLANMSTDCLQFVSMINSPLFNIHNKKVFLDDIVSNLHQGNTTLANFALKNSFYRKGKLI